MAYTLSPLKSKSDFSHMILESLHGQLCWLAQEKARKQSLPGYPHRKLETVLVKSSGSAVSVCIHSPLFLLVL